MDRMSRWGWRAWVSALVIGLGLVGLGIYLQYASYGTVPSLSGGTQGLVKYSGRIRSVEDKPGLYLQIWLDTDRSVNYYYYSEGMNQRLTLEPEPTGTDFAVGDELTAWEGARVPLVEAVTVKSARTGAIHEFTTPEFRDAAQGAKTGAAIGSWLSLAAIAAGLGLLLLTQVAVFRTIRSRRGTGAALASVGAISCLAPLLTIYTFIVVVAASGQASLSRSIYPIVSTTTALIWICGVGLAVIGFSVSRHAPTIEGRTAGTASFVAAAGLSVLWLTAIGLAVLASARFSGIQ